MKIIYVSFLIILSFFILNCSSSGAEETDNENKNGSPEPTEVSEGIRDLEIKEGRTVTLNYIGTTEEGMVFDSTEWEGREALTFTYGVDALIPGFEEGLLGMKAGDTKEIFIPVEKAYGEYSEEAIIQQDIPREKFPKNIEPKVGLKLVTESQGGPLPVEVVAIGEENITIEIDTNHPLAGKNLTFQVEIIDIRKNPENQVENDNNPE